MLHAKIIDIKEDKIKISNAEKFITSSKCGASIYFVGTVRDLNENKKVTGITYDSRDTMVIKSFEEIYKESETKLKIKDKSDRLSEVKFNGWMFASSPALNALENPVYDVSILACKKDDKQLKKSSSVEGKE